MFSFIKYFTSNTTAETKQLPMPKNNNSDIITISVAESVTAGALSNILCSEPGASQYFKGGIVTYDIASKKEILGIDTDYAEKHNFANTFTTLEMAKQATVKFKTRLGIATTGYSTPTIRAENKETGECALNIASPYAIICLYDSFTDSHICKRIECQYDYKLSKKINRATVQTKVSIEGKKMYQEFIKKHKNPPPLPPRSTTDFTTNFTTNFTTPVTTT